MAGVASGEAAPATGSTKISSKVISPRRSKSSRAADASKRNYPSTHTIKLVRTIHDGRRHFSRCHRTSLTTTTRTRSSFLHKITACLNITDECQTVRFHVRVKVAQASGTASDPGFLPCECRCCPEARVSTPPTCPPPAAATAAVGSSRGKSVYASRRCSDDSRTLKEGERQLEVFGGNTAIFTGPPLE